jgi:uncharacterized protein YciI
VPGRPVSLPSTRATRVRPVSTGSLIVAEFASLADAEAWFAVDPFVVAGVYARTSVKPFRQAMP